eukprot:TRINITY_DN28216_c0_g1_i1.p1 TRINITY_DN28216_c0_g1~~TRINITY_DN28216_c0_g1_i1.p1  ORF type:complete len:919 (-),score=157.38 TRINITY_DN28216_c0_g1_i1:468-3224(-)
MMNILYLLLMYAISACALPDVIKLAALFDDNSGPQEAAFQRAIDMVNDDRTILTRSLVTKSIARYPQDDSFKASKKLCELIQPGIAAVFGPTSPFSANHVQSVSEALHVPFMETRWDYDFKRSDYSISVHPHPSVLGKAYAEFVKKVGWKSFVILYENEEGLVRLQELIKMPKTFSGMQVTLRQLTGDTIDYRPLLKEIKKSEETKIVLDCDYEKIALILHQANEIELLTDYHNYLITNIDVDKVNVEAYTHQNVNITGFRIVDPDTQLVRKYLKKYPKRSLQGRNHPLFSENAFMYDSVQVFAKALNNLDSLSTIQPMALSCDAAGSWPDGEKVLSYLKEVDHMGLSGEIRFDADGFRTDFQLDLMEKYRGRLRKTGIWNLEAGINYTMTASEIGTQMIEKLANKTLRVVTTPNSPFVMEKEFDSTVTAEAKARFSFLERYEGFCVDLIKALSKEVKFKFEFQLEPDGSYGSYKNGQWTGMIKQLRSQNADMAIIDMSITSIRQTAVDFTMPYMNTGVGILYKKKPPPPQNLFSFLMPLSLDVWIYMTTAYLGVSITMFLLARLTPFEWENPHPCVDEPEELENELTLHNCFWHNWGSLMQQGSDIAPKAISTRMVAGMWWFFTLIMISSYTANLAAFLTASKMASPVNSAEDLAKQTKIKYGTYCCGSTNGFFSSSSIPTYQKLNAFMESAKPSVYAKSNSEGLDRVRKEDGMYAFFMEAAAIEYHVERFCDLRQLGGLLDSKGYGIALPKDSPYTAAISAGVLALQETGKLKELKIKWWENERGGGACKVKQAGGNAQLSLAQLGGVFIVLVGGMAFSIIIAIFEFAWKRRKLAVDENESLMHEMWEEFKFAVNWRAGDTKPIKTGSQSRVGSRSLLSKSNAESINKYGVILDDDKSRKDSTYATFNENVYGEKK